MVHHSAEKPAIQRLLRQEGLTPRGARGKTYHLGTPRTEHSNTLPPIQDTKSPETIPAQQYDDSRFGTTIGDLLRPYIGHLGRQPEPVRHVEIIVPPTAAPYQPPNTKSKSGISTHRTIPTGAIAATIAMISFVPIQPTAEQQYAPITTTESESGSTQATEEYSGMPKGVLTYRAMEKLDEELATVALRYMDAFVYTIQPATENETNDYRRAKKRVQTGRLEVITKEKIRIDDRTGSINTETIEELVEV